MSIPIAETSGILALIVLLFIVFVWLRKAKRKKTSSKSVNQKTIQTEPHQRERRRFDVSRKEVEYLKSIKVSYSTSLPEYQSNKLSSGIIKDSLDRLRELLNQYPELDSLKHQLDILADDADKPLLVVVMGQFKSGKSSFINTLLGQEALRVDVTPATAAVTMLVYGETSKFIGHMRDGREEIFPLERLHLLSAEGDEEGVRLRSQLSYLEVRLPIEMLKRITIVDTPGLNSDNPLHTEATEFFMERADQVIWMFSYAQAASRFDMSSLQHIQNDLLPIGVVNRIDEHDEEEMDLEDFLNSVKRKTGNRVSHLVGVSAYLASEARLSNNTSLWEESRWGSLETLLDREVYAKGEQKKIVRILSRLQDWLLDLMKEVEDIAAQHDLAYTFIHDNGKALANLTTKLKEAQILYQSWKGHSKWTALYNLGKVPIYVEGSAKLNSQIQIMQSVHEKLSEERKMLDEEGKKIYSEFVLHNIAYSQFEEEFKKYNSSGIFGGAPIFDWDGIGKQLTSRQNELNQKAIMLDSQTDKSERDKKTFIDRLSRTEREALDLSYKIVEALDQTIQGLQNQLDNNEQATDKALKQLDDLDWAAILHGKLHRLITWELGLKMAEIERRFGINGEFSEKIEDVIQRIDSVKRSLANTSNIVGIRAEEKTTPARVSSAKLYELIASAGEGEVLSLPEGIYQVDETIEISKSLTLAGQGSKRTILKGQVDTMLKLVGRANFKLSGIGFDLEGHAGCIIHAVEGTLSIEGCLFTGALELDEELTDGDPPNYENTEGIAICLGADVTFHAQNCHLDNNSVGIALHGNNPASITESGFSDNGCGILFLKASDGTLQKNEFVNNTLGIVSIDKSKPTCKNNRFWNNDIGALAKESSKPFYAYNEFINNGKCGVLSSDASFSTLEGNAFRGNLHGIVLTNSAGGYVYGNRSESNYFHGLSTESDGHLVAEYNHIEYNGIHGVASLGKGEFQLSKNKIINNFDHGVYAEGQGYLEIIDNKISYNRHYGLHLAGSTDSLIERNEYWLNMHGIVISNSAKTKVIENDLMNRNIGLLFMGNAQGTAERNHFHNNTTGLQAIDNTNFKWSGNTVEENKECGIHILNRATGVIEFNKCINNKGFGILNESTQKVDTTSNSCHRNSYLGIAYINDANGRISSNSCEENNAGIRISGQANVEIVGNECTKNRYEGIGLQDSTKGQVQENRCNDNESNGFLVVEQALVHMEDNEAKGNKGSGIRFSDLAKGSIINNSASFNRDFGIYIDSKAYVKSENNSTISNKRGQYKEKKY
ncbi:right-handed parallel beta-helix repeat-containing protein [Paenibacillus sp. USHLN196]|uniref:right-handed parallel beta-helix repeat-containing protein n=1 Tax=Paenibacillus sp. USHLN196 TaxID=3081291 RepID=UPI003017BB39